MFNKLLLIRVFLLICPLLCYGQVNDINFQFEQLNTSRSWKKVFSDNGKMDWKKKWFLDGEKASITNSMEGMLFKAGPEDKNDAHHAVLWTKESFQGNLKIEFDYIKTDSMQKNVTILYIQATGIGKPPYDTDIFKWRNLRRVPAMKSYFNHMNALHVSYAAFSPNGDEYVRARRYPVTSEVSFKDMMFSPSYDNLDGLFEEGVVYHITVLKTLEKLFFKVESDKAQNCFFWDLSAKEPINYGRIGLRHMYTRSAVYKNFNIYSQAE